jgi:glycolate oxidase iron-sulfur subunit
VASRSPIAKWRTNDIDLPKTESRARVALLRGCVMEGLFAQANRATRRVLEINGCEVVEASGQACCGALHSHAGQTQMARELARKNIKAFDESRSEWIITNAAGCGAAMKEYGDLLADDTEWAERARALSSRVRDISEFLIETGIKPPEGRINRRVAYDAPCHLLHAQRISEAPLAILKSIPGIELVALRGSESCCGGAGIYNLQHADLSGEILSEKIENVKASRAEVVATGNPGCIMQIGAGVRLARLDVKVIHPVELLDAAYSKIQV